MKLGRHALFLGAATVIALLGGASPAAMASSTPQSPAPAPVTVSAPVAVSPVVGGPTAAAKETATSTLTAAGTYYYGCTDDIGYTGAQEFWRCTGTSATSTWVGSTCAEGEYNAGSQYNVYDVYNLCNTRVWLHKYTYPKDVTAPDDWSVCVPPANGNTYPVLSPDYVHPENIMVSANTAAC
jgi:hypothetical protein